MPPKIDTTIQEVIASLAESMQTQFKELRESQNQLSSRLESTISDQQSSVKDLQLKFTRLETPSLQSPTLSSLPSLIPTPSMASRSNCPAPSPTSQPKIPKFYLSNFDGTQPHAWLFQSDQYFTFYSIPLQQWLAIAAFFMTGQALSWFQWMYRNQQLSDWDSFVRALELRFGPSMFINPQASLFMLWQTSSVSNYQIEFENLSNRISGLTEKNLLNCFIFGLHLDIQREVMVMRPQSLTQALALAKLIESKHSDSCSLITGSSPQTPSLTM